MKHYVITIEDNPKSVEAAERCIASGKKFGLEIEKFAATTPSNTDIHALMSQHKLLEQGFSEVYSRKDNCIAAFLSHFRLWVEARDTKQEITVFEHDAVVIDNIPNNIPYKGCINLGKPSYGRFKTPAQLGVNSLTSKAYFPGAHAYRIKPEAANTFIVQAARQAHPTDLFINIQLFPWLQEYYPWPVEARDNFTTIQNQAGCVAKHNYGDQYEII